MNKRLSKSLLITLTVFLASFYMGATASADVLSMSDILNNKTSYINAEEKQAGDEIYSLLSESEGMTTELTASSTMVTVANTMYGDDNSTVIEDNMTPTADTPVQTSAEFDNMAIAIVETYVDIRSTASDSGEVVGKLYNGSFATVESEADGWVKIKSGAVEGYVKAESLTRGEEVKNNYQKYIGYIATATVDTLNVRKTASTTGEIVTKLSKGTKCSVIEQADAEWAKISVASYEGYVSKQYITIAMEYKTAISVSDEAALQKAAAQSKLSEAASSVTTTYGSATTINEADMRLLVCLVFCESGSEPYEGKLAVANVVLNRYHSSRYPNTISGVVYQSGQFSPTWNGSLNTKLALYDRGGFTAANHLETIQAVKDALDGKNNIGSRLYFNGYNYEKNRGHQNAVRISNHLFW